MNAIRFVNSNTDINSDVLFSLINDEYCREVRLFASPTTKRDEYNNETDGPDTNLPLLSAWAKYEIPKVTTIYVLFDGVFLTAARKPRYNEVKFILDAAEKSNKVTIATQRAPFTSSDEPKAAIEKLNVIPYVTFTSENRAKFFSMLSNVSEQDFAA